MQQIVEETLKNFANYMVNPANFHSTQLSSGDRTQVSFFLEKTFSVIDLFFISVENIFFFLTVGERIMRITCGSNIFVVV